ncbi:MAG: OmpH family outer membrane protein [Wenzhouxiangella sp.]|nr:OmpH family outer membrane protein [Wenzhouxiangella sp.]
MCGQALSKLGMGVFRRWQLPVFATALLFCLPALAAEAARIGYVDMKRLVDNAPQGVAAREALDQEVRPRNESLLADETRLERLARSLTERQDLDAEARFDLEREIRNLRRSIDRRREDLSEELRFRTNAEKKALEETVEVAVRQVAEQGGYDLVLTSPVAYVSRSIDITDRVLDWLEDDFLSQTSRNNR